MSFWTDATHVQVWSDKDADEEVLAMVVRTGLDTTMGSVLRKVMTVPRGSAPHSKVMKVSSPFHLALPIPSMP